MKIKTLGNRIQLDIKEPSVGGLDTTSLPTAIEFGEVIGVGESIKSDLEVGDKVFFKAWGVDIITHEGKRYYFISEDTNAICALVK